MFTRYKKKNQRVSLARSIASVNQWLLSPTKQMIINIGVEVENEKHLLLLGIQPGTGIMEINVEVPQEARYRFSTRSSYTTFTYINKGLDILLNRYLFIHFLY